MAMAAAEKHKGFTNLNNYKGEKGLGRSLTLGLVLMTFQGCHLSLAWPSVLSLHHSARGTSPK